MISRARAALFSAAALLFSVSSVPSADAADRIWQKSGGRPIIADSVLSDHYDELTYRKGSNELKLSANRVRTVDYGDAPESFELALDKRAEGDYENAASLLKAAMAEKGVRAWIQLRGAFELGETYRLWGARDASKFSEAVKQYDAALAKGAKARIRPDILFGRARANLGAANLDAGLKDLDTLVQEAVSNKYGVTWELRALHEKAEALDEAGRANEAKNAYSTLEKNARSFSGQDQLSDEERSLAAEMAGLARLAQGRVLIRDGKANQAESFFARIVDDEQEVEGVRAAALVGLGESLAAEKKFKEAQLAFAKVRVHHFGATEAVAEATFRLGQLARELGDAEPKGSKLAQDYFLEVVQHYSDSKWAQRAQKELN
ncbi:MAG: hypothetical protein ACF8XB_00035 [Planctomycetota bacterium JB042]